MLVTVIIQVQSVNFSTPGKHIIWNDNDFRYSGYIAWRGVMRAGENPKVAEAIRKAYDMGNTLYFDIAQGTHSVLYELPEERLNWLW